MSFGVILVYPINKNTPSQPLFLDFQSHLHLALEQEDLQQVDGLGHPLCVVHHAGCAETQFFIGGSSKENVAELKQLSIVLSWDLALDWFS